jgi:hypothetical protein
MYTNSMQSICALVHILLIWGNVVAAAEEEEGPEDEDEERKQMSTAQR